MSRTKVVSTNKIPAGNTLYYTGRSDDVVAGTYGNGDKLILTKDQPSIDFKLLEHKYLLGGRAIWDNASIADTIDATLMVQRSTGQVESPTGLFSKIQVAPGLNMFIPGSGWDLDLTKTIPNTQILAFSPVPSPGNNGFFNYTIEDGFEFIPEQTGKYNLFDQDIPVFKLFNSMYGHNGVTDINVENLLGKLVFNTWYLNFTLDTTDPSVIAAIEMAVGVKKSL